MVYSLSQILIKCSESLNAETNMVLLNSKDIIKMKTRAKLVAKS